MSEAANRFLPLVALPLLFVAAGCSSVAHVRSSGAAVWQGLGVEVTLPAGEWEVEEVETGLAVEIRPAQGGARVALFRIRGNPEDSADLILKRLLVYFPVKERRYEGELPVGDEHCRTAGYVVTEDGREILLHLYALRRGRISYGVVA